MDSCERSRDDSKGGERDEEHRRSRRPGPRRTKSDDQALGALAKEAIEKRRGGSSVVTSFSSDTRGRPGQRKHKHKNDEREGVRRSRSLCEPREPPSDRAARPKRRPRNASCREPSAAIDSDALSSEQRNNDVSTNIASRDALPEQIVPAMPSIDFDDDDDQSDGSDDVGMMTPAAHLAASFNKSKPTNEMPDLMDSSFSSLQSEFSTVSGLSVGSVANNVIVQEDTQASNNPMAAFLGSMIEEQEQHQHKKGKEDDENEEVQDKVENNSHSFTDKSQAGRRSVHELARRFEQKTFHREMPANAGTTGNVDNTPEADDGGPVSEIPVAEIDEDDLSDGSKEESAHEESESEDDSGFIVDPPGRRGSAINGFIPAPLTPSAGKTRIKRMTKGDKSVSTNGRMPVLVDSSFSSIDTDISGLQSTTSQLKNVVVNPGGNARNAANPMAAFLGNMMTQTTDEDEEEEMDTNEEADDLLDEIISDNEEGDEGFNGGYDLNDGYNPQTDVRADQRDHNDESSIPSLASFRNSEIAESHSSPEKSVQSMDWRSWVENALLQANQAASEATDGIAPDSVDNVDGGFAAAPPMFHVGEEDEAEENHFFASGYSPAGQHPNGLEASAARGGPNNVDAAPNRATKPKMKVTKKKKKPKPANVAPSPATGTKKKPKAVPQKKKKSASPAETAPVTPAIPAQELSIDAFESLGLPPDSPTPGSSSLSSHDYTARRKKEKYEPKKGPLNNLKNLFKGRRGSPASVVNNNDPGRGEAQFFPTIDEDEEEDWGGLLS